jgi:quinol monooxygenase YgiN
MIIRIVEMTFRPDAVQEFLTIFEEVADQIRQSHGCRSLQLLSSLNHDAAFATLSVWDDDASLQRYRDSEFFRETWSRTRQLFDSPPRAETYEAAPDDAAAVKS